MFPAITWTQLSQGRSMWRHAVNLLSDCLRGRDIRVTAVTPRPPLFFFFYFPLKCAGRRRWDEDRRDLFFNPRPGDDSLSKRSIYQIGFFGNGLVTFKYSRSWCPFFTRLLMYCSHELISFLGCIMLMAIFSHKKGQQSRGTITCWW